MDGRRWQRIQALFEDCLALAPEQQQSHLEAHAGDDPEMIREVKAMLAASADEAIITRRIAGQLRASFSGQALNSGQRVGAYVVDRMIGQGGMGQVFLAHRDDGTYQQKVVIKVLSGLVSPGMRARFHRERQILANLDHPNIARLLDGGELENGAPFLIMDYIDGVDILSYCRRRRCTLVERLQLFERVCAAAQSAHQQLVVHCDIKPANVLVNQGGEPRLLDFGVATLIGARGQVDPAMAGRSAPELPMMSPAYASPEQISGAPVNTASDVYSLGALLYELLTDQAPHRPGSTRNQDPSAQPGAGNTPRLSARPAAGKPSERLRESGETARARALRGDIDAIVLRAMAHRPQDRYGSAGALAEDIRRHLQHLPISARPASWPYQLGKLLRRNPGLVVTAALLAVVAVSFVASVIALNARLSEERMAALKQARTSQLSLAFMVELFEAADPAQHQGREVSARVLLDRGAERISQIPELETEVRARLLLSMAEAYRNMGQFDQALGLYEQVQQQWQSGRDQDPEALWDLALMEADLKRSIGLHDEAKARLRELVVELEQARPGSLLLARAWNNLGIVQTDREQADAGYASVGRALALLEGLAEQPAREQAVFLHNLGRAARAQGDLEAAIEHFRQSLAIKRQTIGPRHPSTLNTLETLANALGASGDREQAIEILKEVLLVSKAVHGEYSLITARHHNELANQYHDLGDYRAAEQAYRAALDYLNAHPDDDRLLHAFVVNNLASLYEDAGDLARALPLFKRSVEMREALEGVHGIASIRARINLARLLVAMADLNAAEALIDEVLGSLATHHPDNDLRQALALIQKARIESLRGQHEQAGARIGIVLQLFDDNPRSPLRARAQAWRERALMAQRAGQLQQAQEALLQASAYQQALFPPEHPEHSILDVYQARNHLLLGDEAAARALLDGRLDRLEAALHPDAPPLQLARELTAVLAPSAR